MLERHVKLVYIDEAMEILGISLRQLYRLIDSHQIPPPIARRATNRNRFWYEHDFRRIQTYVALRRAAMKYPELHKLLPRTPN